MTLAFRTAFALSLCLALPAIPAAASIAAFAPQERDAGNSVGHSGGCRKSSPPGQCCHAGKQPLHCH